MNSNKKRRKQAMEFLRDFFGENPNATVDEAAKAANNARLTLERELVAQVRKQMRSEVKLTVVPPPPSAIPDRDPAGPMVEVRADFPPGPLSPYQLSGGTEAVDDSRTGKMSTEAIAERRKYLNEIVEVDPGLDPHEAIEKVKARFGIGLAPAYAYETVRIAREVANAAGANYPPVPSRRHELKKAGEPLVVAVAVPAPAAVEAPSPAPIVAPAVTEPTPPPAPAEQRLIEWISRDGTYMTKAVGKGEVQLHVLKLLADGIDKDTIRIWKPAALAVQYVVEHD